MSLRLCVLSAAVFVLLSFSSLAAEQDAVPVGVDEVILEPMQQTVPVIGRLIALRAGVVAARISGPVGEFKVEVGDRIAKDEVIAKLVDNRLSWERRLRAADVKEAEAALLTAKSVTDLRVQEMERLERLRTSAAFSQARLDDKRQEVVNSKSATVEAEAALESAKAILKQAEIDLHNTTIYAPYDGVVTIRHTEVGAYVTVGAPVVSLINDKLLEIEADVPAQNIGGLDPGAEVSFRFGFSRMLKAVVRAVIPEENPLTRTRTVRFTPDFAGGNHNLASGQSVTLHLPSGAGRDVITVHKDAVLNRKGVNMVFIIEEKTAQIRPLKLGEAVGSRFEVIGGLKPGDLVVVRGNERLRPGQNVFYERER